MNERIKDLLGQAYDESVPETWTTLSSDQLGRIYEKFAELIVRECAEVAEDYDGAHYVGTAIKQHLGVEK